MSVRNVGVKTRPVLHEIPLNDVHFNRGEAIITFSVGQEWDAMLESAYDAGFILLELDSNENPIRAYKQSWEQ